MSVRYECADCCTAWSGPDETVQMLDKIDEHEKNNNHRVQFSFSGDDDE